MKSLSDKRLIINCKINNTNCLFLVDTGATVGLIDKNKIKELNLKQGRKFNGLLIGAGGSFETSYICDTPVLLESKIMTLFILSDILAVQKSIKLETGYNITGIIGIPLMKVCGMKIDIPNMSINI